MEYKYRFINLAIRLLILGVIVFAVLTLIPDKEHAIGFELKILISLLVVVTYSVLDLLSSTFTATKNRLCDVLC